ncbi:MAG: hypothetical protein ACI3ZD_06285, partial [Prevotella sp.]
FIYCQSRLGLAIFLTNYCKVSAMKNFRFNKIIVLESLGINERHTGEDLYNDLIARMPIIHANLKVEYHDINTLSQWDDVMNDILGDCIHNNNIPIIHFEIHGESNGRGLVIKNHELATLEHVGTQLRKINIATGCNLFITLGVCTCCSTWRCVSQCRSLVL